jgi:hypothetical protein
MSGGTLHNMSEALAKSFLRERWMEKGREEGILTRLPLEM